MKKHRILPLLLMLVILVQLLCFPAAAQEADLQLQCGYALLMDAESGQILYSQQAYEKAYPASITKVMTALLILEAIEDGTITTDTMVTVSELAATEELFDESTADLQAGEEISVVDLLYCLMLPSANDAARALAEHLAGSVDAFADKMNQRAAELGCKNTHFVNPTGLHDPEHYACAYDMVLIFRQAMTHPLFLQVIGATDYVTAPTNLYSERYLLSLNGLISEAHYPGYLYEYCIGGKTGNTEQAGKCLVSAAKKDDITLISVILNAGITIAGDGSEQQDRFVEAVRLFEYGFQNFRKVNLTQPETAVATVAVTLSMDGKEVGVVPRGSIPVLLSNSIREDEIQTEVTLFDETVEAPVAEGQVMGSMRLSYGDQTFGELELVAERSLSFSEKLLKRQNRRAFWAENWGWFVGIPLLLLLLPAAALVALRYINIYRARRRRKRRQAAREAARLKKQAK